MKLVLFLRIVLALGSAVTEEMKQPFSDLESIRARAREHLAEGPVSGAYRADRIRVIEALNEVLATLMTISLACKEYQYAAHRSRVVELSACLARHAECQREVADQVAERVTQLRGTPDFRVEVLAGRSHVSLPATTRTEEIVRESLVAARVQCDTLCAAVRWIGDDDPSTRRVLEIALSLAERFADDMDRLLGAVVVAEPTAVNATARVQRERERWSEAVDKPPWWDPQWNAARG